MIRGEVIVLVAALVTGFASAQQVDWASLPDQLDTLVKREFATHGPSADRPPTICRTTDLTGDGLNEALLAFEHGGAYTSSYGLVRWADGAPSAARMKRGDGRIFPAAVTKGSSAMNVVDFALHLEEHAFSQIRCQMALIPGGAEVGSCDAESYVWNPDTELFEHDEEFSAAVGADYFERRRVREKSRDISPGPPTCLP